LIGLGTGPKKQKAKPDAAHDILLLIIETTRAGEL
jgi:hypothetical protein